MTFFLIFVSEIRQMPLPGRSPVAWIVPDGSNVLSGGYFLFGCFFFVVCVLGVFRLVVFLASFLVAGWGHLCFF